jgi:hypothetical protein
VSERQSTWRQFRALWPYLHMGQKFVFLVLAASVIPTVVLLPLGYKRVGLGLVVIECVCGVLFNWWTRSTRPPDDGR